MRGRTFGDYESAIASSDADLVYVTTTNELHASLAAASLAAGKHVIVDKPVSIETGDAARLVAEARSRRLLVAEATVWTFHPQVAAARRIFDDAGSRPAHTVASFSFPPLPPGNFRHRAALGGGALWDLGPYAVSPGRVFFGAPPLEIAARQFRDEGAEVESGFTMLATYPGGRSHSGHYGMTTGYVNRLEILGPDVTVSLERAFTTPPGLVAKVRATVRGAARNVDVPPADSFTEFVRAVMDALAAGDSDRFASDILADAAAMETLRDQSSWSGGL